MRFWLIAPAIAAALASCSSGTRVEKPLEEVHASLVSMSPQADAMNLATQFPGTAYYIQPDGSRLIWHFQHSGKDYGRFVATLKPDGDQATYVATSFEESNDAPAAGNLSFLRDIARIAGEASVAAALSGQPVDREAIRQRIVAQVAADPMAAHAATIETVSSEIDRLAPGKSDGDEIYPRPGSSTPKPGVTPRVGGAGGPRDEDLRGTESWRN